MHWLLVSFFSYSTAMLCKKTHLANHKKKHLHNSVDTFTIHIVFYLILPSINVSTKLLSLFLTTRFILVLD